MTTTTVTSPTKVKTQDKDQIYDQKLYQITADLKPFRISQLRRMDQNSFAVIEFLYSKMREGNLKPASRASTIDRLCQFSLFHKNKPFNKMTIEDIFSYLESIRRIESYDDLLEALRLSLKGYPIK